MNHNLSIRRLCFFLCLIYFQSAIFCSFAIGDSDHWKNNLSPEQIILAEECRSHVSKAMTVYMNMSSDIKKTVYSRGVSDDGIFLSPLNEDLVKSEYSDVQLYIYDGRYFRADATFYKPPNFLDAREITTFLITPEQSYALVKGKNGYVLMANKMSTSLDVYNLALQLPFNAAFTEAPFGPSLTSDEKSDFRLVLNQGNITLNSISESIEGDDQIVTIIVQKNFDGRFGTYTFNFYRNKSWVLRDYRQEIPSSDPDRMGVIFQKCLYEGTYNGVPLLKECVIEHFSHFDDNGDGPVLHRIVYQFSNIKVGSPSLELFDHELLIGKVGVPKVYPRLRLVFISFGLLLLLLGIYLKVRQRGIPK